MLLIFGTLLCLMVTAIIVITGDNDISVLCMCFAAFMFVIAALSIKTSDCVLTAKNDTIIATSGCDIISDVEIKQESEE